MKVTMTETGGWANVRRSCTVDTCQLSAELARPLETALHNPELFQNWPAPFAARDAKQVTIIVYIDGSEQRASFSEAAPPPQARPLLEMLRPYCKPVPSTAA